MSYRMDWSASRALYLSTYDVEEARKYDNCVRLLTSEDHSACLRDLQRFVHLSAGMEVLDVGAGTGALCQTLSRIPGLKITALEPCTAMLELLRQKTELQSIEAVCGFCDHADDKRHFKTGQFDVIASRQLVNGLFDPLSAFENWHDWLRPNGTVVVMDGFFKRSDWSGRWSDFVDVLPLSCCESSTTVAYLLEHCGFEIRFAGLMDATNALPSTRTQRFMVVATKPSI